MKKSLASKLFAIALGMCAFTFISCSAIVEDVDSTTSDAARVVGETWLNGEFYIKNVHSNLYMDVANGSTANGANIQQHSFNGSTAQRFNLVHLGGGYYAIKTVCSGSRQALDVWERNPNNGTNIATWSYNGGYNQQFKFVKQSDGSFAIHTRVSNDARCIDDYEWGKYNGANCVQWDWWGGACQKWWLEPVSGSWNNTSSSSSNNNSSSNNTSSNTGSGNLVWSDEFNGSSLNSSVWNCEIGDGGWGNNELQYYTNRWENVRVSGGNLIIEARKENYYGCQWTSARINTKGKKEFKYGKITAKIKMPAGKGVWPAFWMLGANIDYAPWPACGEIDVMEHINSERTVYGTGHWDSNGHAEYGMNTSTNKYWTKFDVDVTQWHEYTIDWKADKIRWYVDGKQYMEMDIANGKNNTGAFHKPFYILFNVAMGGSWPGNPDWSTSSNNAMYVDYIRVYN